ncbi:choice-of-anchor I family protein [Terrimonas pollutisoli]|uniref:choice-of-anchor I family protein n=1 Tax=Terrimonas pollutisoli TaxID=3034147 RepID=UPI0023ECC29D|nr:choice-of-anchor I family protein [Terrimonas sp. H1YJ31]
MTTKTYLLLAATSLLMASCRKTFEPVATDELPTEKLLSRFSHVKENIGSFSLAGSIDIGDLGAAEISAFDPETNKLFVVNNSAGNNRIDVIDFADPTQPQFLRSISVAPYGGLVNSVAVKDGLLAAAIEAIPKTNAGKLVVFNTADESEEKVITVGALPDMVTFSPDGKYILTANEGEPNTDYSIDPLGTVSIIDLKNSYAAITLDFSSFAGMEEELKSKGLRKFGPGASFAQDMEPEYITIAADSRTAWVTLQENNAIAKIDLRGKGITNIFPLGFKNYNLPENAIDPSDRPLGAVSFNPWPVYGIYMPDAIAVLEDNKGIPYLFTANEGDAREYSTFAEETRVSSSSVVLNPVLFPNAASLKLPENLGRLNITSTLGKNFTTNNYDALYSFGARSFSVWNGNTGDILFDSKNELDKKAGLAGFYDDDRSDSKGTEPEGIAIGEVNKTQLAFVGMERADAVAIYDVSNPLQPQFLQILETGDAPEGVLFISAKDSPNKRSILVVSSENDGKVKVYMPALLD